MKRPQGFDPPSANRQRSDADGAQNSAPNARKQKTREPHAPKPHGSKAKASAPELGATKAAARKARSARRTRVPSPDALAHEPTPSASTIEDQKQQNKAPSEARSKNVSIRASRRERRRFERREVRRFTRRSRHRRLTWVVLFSVVGVLAGLLAVAIYSPLLSLRTIVIDGVSTVSADEVREAIEGQMGTPLALLDYDKMRTELDAFPRIRSFSTEIVPPSTLKIHIVERSPVGVITSVSGFQIVDPAGVVLESTPRRPDGLPLIDLANGDTGSVEFAAVVDVVLALPEPLRSRVDVAYATSKDDVRLVLRDAGQRVRWGSAERSALKARVLVELMETQDGNAHVEFDVSAPLSPVVKAG